MLCSSCHTDAPDGAAFCPKCGQRLGEGAADVSPVEKLRAGPPAAQGPAEPEQDLWQGKYSIKAMYGQFLAAIFVTIAASILLILMTPVGWIAAVVGTLLIWLTVLIYVVLQRLRFDYRLTSQRFLHKKGILSRKNDQILLVDVDDISYDQGLIARVLGYGTITILANDASLGASDRSNAKLTLVPVDDVQRVADLIDHARREERRKRAIYMANA